MKGFIKWSCILGMLLILTGTGIATAAFAMGGDPERIVWELEERYEKRYEERYGRRYPYAEAQDEVTAVEAGEYVQLQEDTKGAYEIWESADSEQMRAGYDEITSLEIQADGGEVNVNFTDEAELLVESPNGSLNALHYREIPNGKKLTVTAREGTVFDITVPQSWMLEKFEGDVFSGGQMNVMGLLAAETKLEAESGGYISVSQNEALTLDLECESGEIYWKNDGAMPGFVDADCDGGVIEITVGPGFVETMYSYELSVEDGALMFFGTEHKGELDTRVQAEDNDGKFMSLSAEDSGSIVVGY